MNPVEAEWDAACVLFKSAVLHANKCSTAVCIVHDGTTGNIVIVDKNALDDSPFRYTIIARITPVAYTLLIPHGR